MEWWCELQNAGRHSLSKCQGDCHHLACIHDEVSNISIGSYPGAGPLPERSGAIMEPGHHLGGERLDVIAETLNRLERYSVIKGSSNT
jgi:hypothetical protein